MHNFEVFQLPFHLGCLDRLQIQHEEKSFIVGASSMMPVLASIWGAFFSVTFKLPFHALPLLSPHPASFRSFTPWASSPDQLVGFYHCITLLQCQGGKGRQRVWGSSRCVVLTWSLSIWCRIFWPLSARLFWDGRQPWKLPLHPLHEQGAASLCCSMFTIKLPALRLSPVEGRASASPGSDQDPHRNGQKATWANLSHLSPKEIQIVHNNWTYSSYSSIGF